MSKKILKNIVLILCYLAIAWSIFAAIYYLFFDFTLLGIGFALLYPEVSPLLVLTFIVPALIIIRLQFWRKWKGALIIACICSFLLFTAYFQFFSAPFRVAEAETQMIGYYGSSYLTLDRSNMMPAPISLWEAVTGMPVDDSLYSVKTDITYYDNGQDQLKFDYYCPTWGIGPFPVIINIHGGAWIVGSKGIGNTIGFSKYMASKGYVVFDVNYGLYDLNLIGQELGLSGFLQSFWGLYGTIMPIYNKSYTIEEQVENLGRFTKFLDVNNATYNADLDRVFVTGRSAGGHLTYMVGLGIKHPLFAGNFSSNVTIKGIFPIYGPTDMRLMKSGVERGTLGGLLPPFSSVAANAIFNHLMNGSLPLDQMYEKLSPAYLITTLPASDIPPIMIIHGEKDNLCPYFEQSYLFRQIALQHGAKCIMITIPGHGHGFDIFNYQTLGGQMSTYYIERFLALEGG
ncbi:MAG: alpha/beta hydrolase fold domain-containing protein [Candidatus Helarchaeales archaeon]